VTVDGPSPRNGDVWDIVIIGAGLGGGTLGHALSDKHRSVLFIERGPEHARHDIPFADAIDDPHQRMAAGRWPERMTVMIDGRESLVYPPLGCGAGGSSLLFAAALERFARSDIESIPGLPHPTGGWPFAWQDLCRHYDAAERLYRVMGTPDPLAEHASPAMLTPPAASEIDRSLTDSFRRAGLHPYRLHVGIGYGPGCGECGGTVCPARCKRDARLVCVEPSLAHGDTRLVSGAEVERIEADDQRATAVVYRQGETSYRVTGRVVALAAGAYRSPAILLASRSPQWPNGLGNGSDQVGRHLMFHANEWFAVWARRAASTAGPRKTIGFRDFYHHAGQRLGSIQSTGLRATVDNVQHFLQNWFDTSRLRHLRSVRRLLRLVALVAGRLFGEASIFVMIVEDFGYPDNRIVFDPGDPGRITVVYTVTDELRRRAREARRLTRRFLRGLRVVPLQTDVQLNFGHACGTCRAGHDPATSVLDGNCKVHDLDNLYVVDASFMPSSGGTNPGLTVIANALRVAEVIDARLGAREPALAAQ